jgi:large subunit ribosomal protein L4
MGTIRTCNRRGGGRAFAKLVPGADKQIPKKVRRLACGNALLSRIQDEDVFVIDELRFAEPKTKPFASMLSALKIDRGCMVAMHDRDVNVFRSGRNIAETDIRLVDDLNAYEVLRRPKVLFTKQAFEQFVTRAASL